MCAYVWLVGSVNVSNGDDKYNFLLHVNIQTSQPDKINILFHEQRRTLQLVLRISNDFKLVFMLMA